MWFSWFFCVFGRGSRKCGSSRACLEYGPHPGIGRPPGEQITTPSILPSHFSRASARATRSSCSAQKAETYLPQAVEEIWVASGEAKKKAASQMNILSLMESSWRPIYIYSRIWSGINLTFGTVKQKVCNFSFAPRLTPTSIQIGLPNQHFQQYAQNKTYGGSRKWCVTSHRWEGFASILGGFHFCGAKKSGNCSVALAIYGRWVAETPWARRCWRILCARAWEHLSAMRWLGA